MFCYAPCSCISTDLLLSKGSKCSRENNKKTYTVPYNRKDLYVLHNNVLQYSQNGSCPFGQLSKKVKTV